MPQRQRLHDRTLVRFNGHECGFCEKERKRADYRTRKQKKTGTLHELHPALDEFADLMEEAA